MAPVRERPGPIAVDCHECGRHVRLATDGALEAHNQWGVYDRPCHATWPPEKDDQ